MLNLPPRVLPDCQGTIQLVHINIVCSRSGAPLRNSRLVAEIVNSLPKHVETILLGSDRNFYSESMDLCKERRIFYLEVPSGVSFSAWAQDPFLAMCEGDKGALLASRSFDRVDDRQIPRILASHLGWECIDSSLVFEGGNIVIDENNIYVGADTIYQNARDSHDNNSAVMHRLEKESGRRVVIIGPYPQPVGHLDSILTPLGNNVLALADPMHGAVLAEKAMCESQATVEEVERGFENSFFSDGSKQYRMVDGTLMSPPNIVGRTREAIYDSRALAPTLDRLAELLEKNGFKIHRIPFLYRAASPYKPAPSVKRTQFSQNLKSRYPFSNPKFGAQYPCMTYNNVLLDVSGDKRTVYLPQYGWPALDNAARLIWHSMGYAPKLIAGFAIASMFGGQLRCMTKVLKRNI